MKRILAIHAFSILVCTLILSGAAQAAQDDSSQSLAQRILTDDSLTQLTEKAEAMIRTGFNAGAGYNEIWIRDFNTFMELASHTHEPEILKENLLIFFQFQGEDGNVVDGFVPREQANISYDYITSPLAPDYLAHKNTVETDHESSLIQAVYKYIRETGDDSILDEIVGDKTVLERMRFAVEFLLNHRWADEYGLLWGATTADWGDVQPEHEWGVVLDENSHLAIDIYDNALFMIALDNLSEMLENRGEDASRWGELHQETMENIRRHIWDEERQKFIPHIYLDGSPFPDDFDEDRIFYHGGTTVAMMAGVLTQDEIARSLETMRENVRQAGAHSIGLTMYPPYPEGFFMNPYMAPYSYQNGGDWCWYGGRTIQALVQHGLIEDAYIELQPMVERVLEHDGFHEWWRLDGSPAGSGTYRGSAGVLWEAIRQLRAWAKDQGADN